MLGLSVSDLSVMDFVEIHELTVEKSKVLSQQDNGPREATENEIKNFFGI